MHCSKPLSDLVMRSAAAATDKTRLLLCGSNNTAVIITLGGAPLTTHMLVEALLLPRQTGTLSAQDPYTHTYRYMYFWGSNWHGHLKFS